MCTIATTKAPHSIAFLLHSDFLTKSGFALHKFDAIILKSSAPALMASFGVLLLAIGRYILVL